MIGLLPFLALAVVGAYVVSLVGPSPRATPMLPQDQATLQAAAQQSAFAAQQSQATLAALQTGQLFQPGFQGQPGASVAGVLVWRGERTSTGAKIVYDSLGNAHLLLEGPP